MIEFELNPKIPCLLNVVLHSGKLASVMVWAEVTSTGLKTPLIFIEAGVKMNQHAYLKMLKGKVVPWVEKVIGNKGITFQHDGAIPYTARLVQNWCKDNFNHFGPKNYGLHFLLI